MGLLSDIRASFSKLSILRQAIKCNGGIRGSIWKLFLVDDLKEGKLVGEDKYGNTYYENNRFFFGRNRWIRYGEYHRFEYDGSMVPAEWYGWLHYKTDLVPCEDEHRRQYSWTLDHLPNMSGTPMQYYPYSTVPPKIEAWNPNKK